jgi:hypothetical protein
MRVVIGPENCSTRIAGPAMPATFNSFGLNFLYPENWVVSAREPGDREEGLTLELPGGGFFAVEFDDDDLSDAEILDRISAAIKEEYTEIETESVAMSGAGEGETAVDFRFFFLDLLVVSRVVLLNAGDRRLIVQFQAESRDFDANELVLDAILKQIREQTVDR